jgi:hypothetical protein
MNFVDGSFWHLAANVRFQTHADMPISDFFVHAPYRVRDGTFRWLTSRNGCAVRGAGAAVSV